MKAVTTFDAIEEIDSLNILVVVQLSFQLRLIILVSRTILCRQHILSQITGFDSGAKSRFGSTALMSIGDQIRF